MGRCGGGKGGKGKGGLNSKSGWRGGKGVRDGLGMLFRRNVC